MEWISTDDRRPNHNEHVIGYCRTPLNQEWHVEPLLFEIHKHDWIYSETWAYLFAYNPEGYGYGYAIEVSMWMPLPSPPESK